MPTIGDATEVVREEMPAPKMEQPQPTPAAADSLETAMKNPPVRWVSTFLETMPKVNYPISLDQLAKMVQESYLKRTMQPSYVVKDTKPGAWIIDGAPKNNVRLGIREFAPNVRSVKMKKRMYTKATYARRFDPKTYQVHRPTSSSSDANPRRRCACGRKEGECLDRWRNRRRWHQSSAEFHEPAGIYRALT